MEVVVEEEELVVEEEELVVVELAAAPPADKETVGCDPHHSGSEYVDGQAASQGYQKLPGSAADAMR